MSEPQLRALVALVQTCGEPGCESTAKKVAEAADLRHGNTVVILRSLAGKGLVTLHQDSSDGWTPTMSGRALVRAVKTAERSDAAWRPAPE